MLVNKIGDMFLILATMIIVHFTKGSTVIATAPFYTVAAAASIQIAHGFSALDLLAVSLVIAALVKSAQIFFHT